MERQTPSRWWLVGAGAALAAGALVLVVALSRGGGGETAPVGQITAMTSISTSMSG